MAEQKERKELNHHKYLKIVIVKIFDGKMFENICKCFSSLSNE